MKRRDRRRSGFIFIVGWRVLTLKEKKPEVRGKCPACGVEDARLIGRIRRAWFTMFFIPIVPLDRIDRAQRLSQCRECKEMFDLTIEQLARKAGAGSRNSFADAIAMYNRLRDEPANGQLMLQLLKAYEALGEPGEAESAARQYPKAVEAEPACAVLLANLRSNAS
jgi:hypothetical protein